MENDLASQLYYNNLVSLASILGVFNLFCAGGKNPIKKLAPLPGIVLNNLCLSTLSYLLLYIYLFYYYLIAYFIFAGYCLLIFESTAAMEWEPPSPGLPLWVKFAEWGFYGFKPTICALCCLKTHDISKCPKSEYFPGFVQEHTNMINDSKRNWNNPYSEFYTPSLQKHLELYFGQQSNMPQELSVEKKLSKLWESTKLYIEITNEGFQIQALSCETSFEDQEEIGVGTEEQSATHSRPGEKEVHPDLEILTEPFTAQVSMTHIPHQAAAMQPTKLQESFKTASTHGKLIIIEEIECRSIKQAKAYEKKTFCGSQIPQRQIRPMHKLWVLNTRFKPIQQRPKRYRKGVQGPYLFTKTHSFKRVDKKDSTNEFKCTVQVSPYLLTLYDAAKEWIILKEQVT